MDEDDGECCQSESPCCKGRDGLEMAPYSLKFVECQQE